jgi:hypothetical protein
VQVGNGLCQTIPAGIQVVHVHDVGSGEAYGKSRSEACLARTAGSVDGHDFRGAATWLGLSDDAECLGDRLARVHDLHVWTVDSQGPWRPLARLTG